jgi:hypothetical protein
VKSRSEADSAKCKKPLRGMILCSGVRIILLSAAGLAHHFCPSTSRHYRKRARAHHPPPRSGGASVLTVKPVSARRAARSGPH